MPTDVELWLVRHAESAGNVDGTDADTGLSPRGYEQSRLLADVLVGVPFDGVWTSPLSRARETAVLVLPSARTRADARLSEFQPGPPVQFIDTSSLDLMDLRDFVSTSASGSAETGKEFIARVKGWLSELPSTGRVIAFTHSGVVREILSGVIGFRNVPQRIPHASVYRLELGAEPPRATLLWEPALTDRRGEPT